jgi:hypothetical protein
MALRLSLQRTAAAEAELGNPDFPAKVTSVAVWAFAIVIAVNQIGIATTLVNTLFMAIVGAVALAFGLGARKMAGEIVRYRYRKGQVKQDQISALPTMPQTRQRKTVPVRYPTDRHRCNMADHCGGRAKQNTAKILTGTPRLM